MHGQQNIKKIKFFISLISSIQPSTSHFFSSPRIGKCCRSILHILCFVSWKEQRVTIAWNF